MHGGFTTLWSVKHNLPRASQLYGGRTDSDTIHWKYWKQMWRCKYSDP